MPRGNFNQTSFLGGEYSPFFQGRSNVQDYYDALNLALNYLPTDEGALARRSGLRFSAHAKNDSGSIRLLPFVAETSDALIVEATAGFLRFHRRGTLLTDTVAEVINISTASPAVVTTSSAHGLTTGDTVVFLGVPAQGLFNRQFVATVLTTTTFSIAHTGPLGTGPVDGNTLQSALLNQVFAARVVERVVPYTAAQLAALKHTSERSIFYMFHPSHQPRTLDRATLTVTANNLSDGPYFDLNTTGTTLAFSGTSGSVTVTASSAAGINGGQGFLATDIGRAIRIDTGTVLNPSWSWMRITARASATSVTASILGPNLVSGAANTKWRLGVYSDTTGWPSHGVIHEGRLFIIGATGRIDGSRNFDFFNFAPTEQDGTVADNNGVSVIIAGAGRQNMRWLTTTEAGLLAGADGGEFVVRASSLDDPITPFTIQVRRHTDYGCADRLPVRGGRNTVFIQELGRWVMQYSLQPYQAFDGADLALTARHLTSKGITELAYSRVPRPVVWCLRGDSRVCAVTFRDDAQGRQVAWHRHSFEWGADVAAGEDADGRYLRGGQSRTNGTVFTITSAPFSDVEATRNDNLWVAIRRGTTVCVEYLTPVFDETFQDNEVFMVDSGNVYRQEALGGSWSQIATSPPTFQFFGLDRLNGQSVTGTFRGADLGTATVSSGSAIFVVSPELASGSAAFDTTLVVQASSTAAAFSGGFITRMYVGTGVTQTTPRPFPTGGGYLIGENNVVYQLLQNSSTSLFELAQVPRSGGVITKTQSSVLADVAGAGVTPPGGWIVVPTTTNRAFVISGTPYLIVPISSASGPNCDHAFAYYKVNASGALQFIGACAFGQSSVFGFQFIQDATNYVAQGFWFGEDSDASSSPQLVSYPTGTDFRQALPIVVANANEGGERILILPPVAVFNSGPAVVFQQNLVSRTLDLSTYNASLDNLFIHGPYIPRRSRGFFLPGKAGRTILFSYIRRESLAAHAALTASNPCPAITAVAGGTNDPRLFEIRLAGRAGGSPNTTMSPVGFNTNGRTKFGGASAFPDVGLNFNGTTGVAGDDYLGAVAYPTNLTNPLAPWLVLFGRVYINDYERAGIRGFLWDPKTETATQQFFINGRMFDAVASGVTLYPGFGVAGYWPAEAFDIIYRPSTGALSWIGTWGGTGDGIISNFGTVTVTTSGVNIVSPQHIDGVLGLAYTSRAQLLRPDLGSGTANGPGLAKTRRTDQYGLLTYRTGDLKIGTDFNDLKSAVFVNVDSVGRRPLFSGVFRDALRDDYSFNSMTIISQDRPVPGTIVAYAGFISTQDR